MCVCGVTAMCVWMGMGGPCDATWAGVLGARAGIIVMCFNLSVAQIIQAK